MVSAIDLAKRSLVKVLKKYALLYLVATSLGRDSTAAQVRAAYRKVSLKAHPDHGGDGEHQKELNVAFEAWQQALQGARGQHGGKRKGKKGRSPSHGQLPALTVHEQRREKDGYRFQSAVVLLTAVTPALMTPWLLVAFVLYWHADWTNAIARQHSYPQSVAPGRLWPQSLFPQSVAPARLWL